MINNFFLSKIKLSIKFILLNNFIQPNNILLLFIHFIQLSVQYHIYYFILFGFSELKTYCKSISSTSKGVCQLNPHPKLS